MTEIKKAFEQMKKELKKQDKVFGNGFTLSAKQEERRTATFLVTTTATYENMIVGQENTIQRVSGYDSWTDEEKARSIKRTKDVIELYKAEQSLYGTKENKLKQVKQMLEDSEAFKKFQTVAGQTRLTTEIKEDFYMYIRFNW